MSTAIRREPNPWVIGVVAGMASYIDSAALVGVGIALAIYQGTIGITPNEIGLASGALTLSVAVGAVVGGRLGDRFGRRRVFMVTMVLVAVGSALLTFSTGFPPILAGAALLGLGVGADLPTSLATISESSPERHRGKILSLSGVLWLLGIIAAVAIASFAGGLGRPCAQILVGQVGVVAIIVLIARIPIPESRVWIEQRRRRIELGPVADGPKSRLRDVVRAPFLVPLLGLAAFYTLTNIGANTNGQFNTYIALNYANTTVQAYNQWALVALFVGLGGGVLFMRIVDTRLRMPFFVGGGVLIVVSYFVYLIAGFSLTTMVVSLFLSALGNGFAFEGVMKIWTQESFPALLRGTAQGTILAAARVVAALAAAATPAVLQIGAGVGYAGLGVLAAIGLVIGFVVFRRSDRNEFARETVSPATTAAAAPVRA